jgi:phage tail sheath protein FI
MLLIQIEPAIAYALEDFIFELNNAATRSMVRVIIDSYMKGIMAANGVLDYYIVCDDTNNTPSDIDNHILNVWLFVKPALSIEYIKFTTVITSTGLDFGLAAQAL